MIQNLAELRKRLTSKVSSNALFSEGDPRRLNPVSLEQMVLANYPPTPCGNIQFK